MAVVLRIARFAALGAVILGVASCTTTRTSVTDDFVPGAGGQALVIGRVDGGGLDGAIPVANIDFFDRMQAITLTIENDATGERSKISCDQTGGSGAWFFVALPPGSYSVLAVAKGTAHEANGQHVDAIFERAFRPNSFGVLAGSGRGRTSVGDPEGREPKFVVGSAPVVYIGTLAVTRELEHREAGWYFAGIPVSEGHGDWYPEFPYSRGWSLKDERDEMMRIFRARYPRITQEPAAALMVEGRER